MNRSLWYLLAIIIVLPACEISSSGLVEDDATGSALELPVHTGAFKVGSATILVVDEDRDDEYTPEPDRRSLVVTLLYPADQEGLGQVQYLHPTVVELLAATQDYLPAAEVQEKFGRIGSQLTAGAPVTSALGRLPVVFWSHGLGGVAGLYTTFAADLASHGFLVVAIDHTYGAFASVFPDGSIKSIRTGANAPSFPTVVEIWAKDMASVLDRLTELDANDPDGLLTGRLDLSRVGATGHSTGGSAAAEILTLDDRFLAAVTLDAPQVGRAAEGDGVDNPLEIFFANPSEYPSTAVEDRLQVPGLSLTLDGTTHHTFTDLPILLELADVPMEKRLESIRPMGTIDPYRNLQVINDWTLAFFDSHLRQGGSAVLDQALYPELSVRRIGFTARASR